MPKVPREAWPDDDAPPVMWSAPGSGFEASPYSPAGRAQGMWRMARGLSTGRRRRLPRWVVITQWVLVIAIVGPLLVALLSSVPRWLW